MRLILLSFLCTLLLPPTAQAEPKILHGLIWNPWRFHDLNWERRLHEDSKTPNNAQWNDDGWQPQDWLAARGGSVKKVIKGLYAANIITDQDVENGIPVLEVGEGFLRLSGLEKRRVAEFIDAAYGISKKTRGGAFHIIYEHNDIPLGLYTSATGLQLQ